MVSLKLFSMEIVVRRSTLRPSSVLVYIDDLDTDINGFSFISV